MFIYLYLYVFIHMYHYRYIFIYRYHPWNLKLTEPLKNSMFGRRFFLGGWGMAYFQGLGEFVGMFYVKLQTKLRESQGMETAKFLEFYLTKWMVEFETTKMFVCLFVWGSVWNMFWLPPWRLNVPKVNFASEVFPFLRDFQVNQPFNLGGSTWWYVGQVIATSAEVTPNGGVVRESPKNLLIQV